MINLSLKFCFRFFFKYFCFETLLAFRFSHNKKVILYRIKTSLFNLKTSIKTFHMKKKLFSNQFQFNSATKFYSRKNPKCSYCILQWVGRIVERILYTKLAVVEQENILNKIQKEKKHNSTINNFCYL